MEKNTRIYSGTNDILKVYNYAVQTRYPGEYAEIIQEEYEQSILIAEKCLKRIEEK